MYIVMWRYDDYFHKLKITKSQYACTGQYIIPLNPKSAQHPFSPNEIDTLHHQWKRSREVRK